MDKETRMMLEQILAQLATLSERLEKYTTDLTEFSDRFEEVMSAVEDERRLDLMRDNY